MLFRFDITGMQRLYDHAHENPNLTAPEPSFVLVIDHGIYFVDNGVKKDNKTAAELDLVVYAENCDPSKNENHWDEREALNAETGSGDDFTQKISCKWLDMILELNDKREFLVLEITADQVILILEEEKL